MRWRITSARPGFWDTACCNAAAAWAGGGGFWPATSVGRTKSTEHRAASANTGRSTTPRSELLRALCSVIMVLLPPKGSTGNGGITWELRSEEHTSELQSQSNLVCRLLLEKKKKHTHSARIPAVE